MNYLAHTYLSGNSEGVIVGNFIGDFVKGSNYKHFSSDIQKGILLHRAIDSYTDSSPIVKQSKSYFAPLYGRYSSIIVDIVYDHFLSSHWKEFSNVSREFFIQNTYIIILKYYAILPSRAHRLIPSIVYHNWMRYYASFYGLEKVLSRMATRTSLPQQSSECIKIIKANYDALDKEFLEFFDSIRRNANYNMI